MPRCPEGFDPRKKENSFGSSFLPLKLPTLCRQLGAVAKWKFCSGPFFRPKGQREPRDCGKPAAKLSVFCMTKPALVFKPAPVEKGFNYSLSSRNLGQMRSQSSLVTFHPELFQVKSKCQKEQLRANILPSPCEEAAEAKVVLEQPEGAFHLD